MNRYKRNSFIYLRYTLLLGMALMLTVGLIGIPQGRVSAANPIAQQFFYVSLPEDDLLQLFDDDDAAGGTFPDPVSPIRSITSISISSAGTWVYYDQWEDGGYDATISEPGANVYNAATNPDGTQIWGDGVLSNGCPPNLNNVPNACLVASDDLLNNGHVIILDNEVAVSGTSPGPYSRNPAQVFFDGRDKIGASFPVAVSRGAFPVSPGSVMAGGSEMLETSRWGTNYEAPLGENTSDSNTNAFEDTRWFIMAGAGGATIDVDANGDGDLLDANDLNDFVMTEGAKRQVNGILMGATLTVVGGNPVQVNSMTADVDDTFEFRWDALLPTESWSNDYYTPVGTQPKTSNSGCTEVEVYNPNATTITINYDFPGGSSPDGSFTVPAGTTATGQTTPATPLVPYNNGARYWSVGGENFLPISVTDCTRDLSGTDGRLYDWGNPLFPADQLTDQALVGWAPGCSNESLLGICEDVDITTGDVSRNVVWVTPLADTTLYIDTDGSGITCPGGGGAEQTQVASALVSYRFTDDPTTSNKVRDDFGTVAYSNNNGTQNWSNNWDETGDDDLPGSGSILITGGTLRITGTGTTGNFRDEFTTAAYNRNDGSLTWAGNWTEENDDGSSTDGTIYINTTDDELRFRENSTTDDAIRRTADLSSYATATLSFELDGSGIDNTGDDIKVQVSDDGGSTWTDLQAYSSANDPGGAARTFDITDYIAVNTTIRFIMVGNLEPGTFDGERWDIDDVDISVTAPPPATAGDSIEREANLSGQVFSDLTFQLTSSGTLDPDDELAVDVSSDGGATWRTLATYKDDPTTTVKAIIMSPYKSANTRIRFRQVNNLEAGEYWNIDQVQIKYAPDGDYDMTGARIATCDGTAFAAAWGQDPALSGGNDDEALDLGTGIPPLGSRLVIEKSADKTEVAVGGLVTYTYEVRNFSLVLSLEDIEVIDNKCAPAVYSSGDDGDGMLEPFTTTGEIWEFTCTSDVFVDTTNVAYATGWNGLRTIVSAPDQWTVTVIPEAVIGNYIWLDEDGDGDQDAGEAGIPNMKVELCTDATCTTVLQTTYTDSNGGYLFDGLEAGTYYIRTTPAAGLNPTYDEDGTGTQNTSVVTVTAGDEHLSADFGYNWSSTDQTNNNTGTGAIGDRVWVDADGDGVQDSNEIGLAGIPVSLYTAGPDGVFGTGDDVLYASTTTDYNGNYIFDELPAGAYTVVVNGGTDPAGYSQSGDPDGELDNQTTDPILLSPGDVYLNADFGYLPTGDSGTIGDTIWMDANRDNTKNPGEQGIAGVTVALIDDLDGDGIWDPGEPIIAVDITDENGQYEFAGLPVGEDADYLVWVNDTDNVLGELSPVYDVLDGANQGNPASGVDTGFEISAVSNLSAAGEANADFAYAPPGHQAGEGLIGDTIWLDRDGDGLFDPGEGLEGVEVTITDPGFDGILGTADDTTRSTYTDENGNYYFKKLEPSLSYEIEVNTTTLPAGVTNTVDPDGTTDSTTVIDLSTYTGGICLNADFAYEDETAPNTISGTIWEDTNADGTLTEAGRFVGVTVVLRDANGNIVATTTTDSSGNYSFSGLPDGTYTVDVTDDYNVLFGYWHSDGPNDGLDNNSQVDPYTVTVSGGQTNTTADFGYYVEPAGVGNYVWIDEDFDGFQDPDELPLVGVKVTLTITYPDSSVVTLSTYTDENGEYSFESLLLDEDFDGSGTGEPSYTISVEIPTDLVVTTANAVAEDVDSDGELTSGYSVVTLADASLVMGVYNPDYDFGFTASPTAINLPSNFQAGYFSTGIRINWDTDSEWDITGFRLYRSISGQAESVVIYEVDGLRPIGLIIIGASYSFVDLDVESGVEYTYLLEVIHKDGSTTLMDPITRTGPYLLFAPLLQQ